MSTHNIRFHGEIRKIFRGWGKQNALSGAMCKFIIMVLSELIGIRH